MKFNLNVGGLFLFLAVVVAASVAADAWNYRNCLEFRPNVKCELP